MQFDCKRPESVRSRPHVACRWLLEAFCLREACPSAALFVGAVPKEFGCRGALLLHSIAGGFAAYSRLQGGFLMLEALPKAVDRWKLS